MTSNHKLDDEIYDSINTFFIELSSEGEYYASRHVRGRLGQAYLRDNEENGIRLPPSYSKRMVYDRWCYSRGWIIGRGGSDGSLGSIKSFQKRAYDDLDFPSDSDYNPIC